ncbi:MAG: hypothetical protein P9M14_05675 [Candidatus Alcyoniella australis]|nr:hypothetical protein [Candidatus Alcyoniella australis]
MIPDLLSPMLCPANDSMSMTGWQVCARSAGFHAGLIGSVLVHLYYTSRAWRYRWQGTLINLALFVACMVLLSMLDRLPLEDNVANRFIIGTLAGSFLGYAVFGGALARWNKEMANPDLVDGAVRLCLPWGFALLFWLIAAYTPEAASGWASFVAQLLLGLGALGFLARLLVWVFTSGD